MTLTDFPSPLCLPEAEEFQIDKVQAMVRQHVPALASNISLRQSFDQVSLGMVMTLAAQIAGKDTEETHTAPPRCTVTESVPLTWWGHAKQALRLAMPRLCGRLTVRERGIETMLTQTVTTSHTRTCPHIGVENQYAHLRFLVSKPVYFTPSDLAQMDDNRHRREREAQNGRHYPIKPAQYPAWTSPHDF